jgi:nucleoside 2-deoxyribosyltransferase
MKLFLSYRFTGEDPVELNISLSAIISVLRTAGHEVYCSIEDESWFQEQKRTNREIMEHAFSKLDESDAILAYIKSDEKSEGMLVEIGYAIAKGKRLILAVKQGVKTTSISQMASPCLQFDTIDDLILKLQKDLV